MKDKIKHILFIVGSIICLVLAIFMSIIVFKAARFGVFLILLIGLLLLGVPFLIRNGLKKLYKERAIYENLLSRNVELKYDYKRIFGYFAEVLAVFWAFVPLTFLIPTDVLTAVILIPSTFVMFVFEAKVSDIWEDIGWRKSKYWLMNFGIYILGLIIGYCLKILIY